MPHPDDPAPLGGARRILLYGVTGAGKTTAAARIRRATGIPWTSVDDVTWEPGWVPVSEDEQRRRIADICARPAWMATWCSEPGAPRILRFTRPHDLDVRFASLGTVVADADRQAG
ncbi:MAG TPA: hypothetical protein VFZ64_03780 [Nocardioidaceae bacterium]